MAGYGKMDARELKLERDRYIQAYDGYREKNLKLTMMRGIPDRDQLNLTTGMLTALRDAEDCLSEGVDCRNYGMLDGLPEAKRLFAELLEVSPEMVILGGNASLSMMYDTVARSMTHGVSGGAPWLGRKTKFLCPSPGYDRHFSICQHFGIEMIPIRMTQQGPDMDAVERFVHNDDTVKGIWCVPKYSNPDGITYSEETVRRFAALRPAAQDFRIFWDNAYAIHDLYDEGDRLQNIFEACREYKSEDMVYEFASTSKVSFPGGGVAVMAASASNIEAIKKQLFVQTIGPDKLNQLRHVRFFKNAEGMRAHMRLHAALLRPKFETVALILETELRGTDTANWTNPRGGYFVSVNVLPGCAKRVVALMSEAGVMLTEAGATFPYKHDPEDRNIRLSVTFPKVAELETAMTLLCICIKLAAAEKLLHEKGAL